MQVSTIAARIKERVEVRGPPREKEGDMEERQKATERKRERGTREGMFVRSPKVPEPILPSYLNSNSKYRRGLLTYCLFRLDRGDSERVKAISRPKMSPSSSPVPDCHKFRADKNRLPDNLYSFHYNRS